MRFSNKKNQELLESIERKSQEKIYHILIIEDDENDFTLIRDQLGKSSHNIEIKAAEKLSSVKRVLRENKVDIVLCDYSLGETSGKDILKIVRAQFSKLPFIIVNGTEKKEAVEIMQLGANDCVMKNELELLEPVIEREITYLENEQRLIEERNTLYHHLQERIKEQECLYKISIIDQQDLPIEEMLHKAVNILPSGFQHPEITEAQVQYDGLVYQTDNFEQTPWSISCQNNFIKYGPLIFTVAYLEERPELDEGPFMNEEMNLLNSVLNQLAVKINRTLDQKELEDQRDLLERSNAMAKVGHWEVDLTQNKVHWCSEVKKIHEVSNDFTPGINEGIRFYKEGIHRKIARKVFKKAVDEGVPIDEELKIITAKNNERWIRVIGEPDFIDEKCVRVFGSFQDITDKKNQIYELEQERKRLKEAQSIGEIGDWDYNLETGEIFWSDQIYNIYGRDPETGPPSYDELLEYYADNGVKLDKEIKGLSKESGIYKLDLEILSEIGKKKYVYHEGYAETDDEGNIIKLHGIVQNITQRKQKELEVLRRDHQLSSVTNNVDAVVFRYLLHPDGTEKMMFVSDNIERLYEIPASKAMETTQSAWDLVLEEDIPPFKKSIECSADTLTKWTHRFRIKTPRGTIKWIEGHGHPKKLSDGSVQWDTMIIDVTRQVQQERTNDILVQEVHHRVKNNLAIISSLLQIQLLELSEDSHERLQLERAVNRIFSISEVHKLLYEGSNLVDIDPGKYFNRLFNHISETMDIDSQVNLEMNIDVDKMNINELTPLGMLMNELVTNSIKYAFSGAKKGKVYISLSKKNEQYYVIYKDNGPGIKDSQFKMSKGSGLKIAELLLDQLEATYQLNTKNQFSLEFTFKERLKGSHSNHHIPLSIGN